MKYPDLCMCCVCANTIFPDEKNPEITIILKNYWDRDEDEESEQLLFAHLNCIKTKMYDESIIYI